MVYIGLLTYAIDLGGISLRETAMIDVVSVVVPILPLLLLAAALSAQFSAATADTSSLGGPISETTRRRITEKTGYACLIATGLVLMWSFDVFQVIWYASRALALYYAIKAGIAARAAFSTERPVRGTVHIVLSALGLAIAAFGIPVE